MWGRKRRLADAERRLAVAMEAAAEAHRRLAGTYERMDGLCRAVRAACGHGDGMPTSSLLTVVGNTRGALESFEDFIATYLETRDEWTHTEVSDPDAAHHAAQVFELWAERAEELADQTEEPMANLEGVHTGVQELRIALPAVRARAHAALTAARNDLLWARSSFPGRFALEARLNALGDRLRELDAGRVELNENDGEVTDWYREVETGAAEVRDALSRPLSFEDR
ncbi:hypothetical protein ACSNOK_17970 [Streptomyces sp. URMC 126]|uniref:hypothetical protein n=1 Tax=Streptomyces sp. URMC 126 TaxID=3423401 RepID=UPI003F1D84A1